MDYNKFFTLYIENVPLLKIHTKEYNIVSTQKHELVYSYPRIFYEILPIALWEETVLEPMVIYM